MSNKYECPRCGCGIKPNDIQCDRCGESLRKSAAKAQVKAFVYDVSAERPKGTTTGTVDENVRRAIEQKEKDLAQKERALADKEQKVDEMAISLEADTSSLEEAIKRFDKEKDVLHSREAALLANEQKMLELSHRIEGELIELSKFMEDAKSASFTAEDVVLTKKMRDRFLNGYHVEMTKLHRDISQIQRYDLDRIIELEARLRAAEDVVNKVQKEKAMLQELAKQPPMSFNPDPQLIREIEREIDDQIGAGFVPTTAGMPIPTKLEKLDTILGGGIPAGHLIMVSGGPGSMKSTLTFAILHNVVRYGGASCLYFSMEQTRSSLLRQMARMGMSLEGIEDRLLVVDMVDLRKSMEEESGDWRSILLRYVKNVHAQRKFQMFVLDSLESFRSVSAREFDREEIKDLFDWFRDLNITVFLIAEASTSISTEGSEEAYLADGVIEMMLKEISDTKIQRWIRVSKMRGMNVDTRYYSMMYNGHDFVFTMPIVEIEKHHMLGRH